MKEKPYILVVDDDPNIAKLEQLYLEKAGYEVKTVGRGDDAMTEFRKMPPDLMLLDVMMPGMDGWQVLKAVRKSSNIPIIMVTSRDETFDKVRTTTSPSRLTARRWRRASRQCFAGRWGRPRKRKKRRMTRCPSPD